MSSPVCEWTRHVDAASCAPFFHSAITGESRWGAPAWRRYTDDASGRPYWGCVYLDAATGETVALSQWTDPTWKVYWDETHALPYWFNADTGERVWEQPPHAPDWAWDDEDNAVAASADGAAQQIATQSEEAPARQPVASQALASAAATEPASAHTHTHTHSDIPAAAVNGTAPATATASRPVSMTADSITAIALQPPIQPASSPSEAPAHAPAHTHTHTHALHATPEPTPTVRPVQPAPETPPSKPASHDASRPAARSSKRISTRQYMFVGLSVTAEHAHRSPRLSAVSTATDASSKHSESLAEGASLDGGTSASDAERERAPSPVSGSVSDAEDAGNDGVYGRHTASRQGSSRIAADEFTLPDDTSVFQQLLPAGVPHVIPAGCTPLRDAAQADAPDPEPPAMAEICTVMEATTRLAMEYRRKLLTHPALKKLTFFRGISVQEARTLAGAFTLWAVRGGTPIVTEGDIADCLFYVAKGALRLYSARKYAESYGRQGRLPPRCYEDGASSLPSRTPVAAGGVAHTQVPVPLACSMSDAVDSSCLETLVCEGQWFGIESLLCDAYRHEWSAVAVSLPAAAPPAPDVSRPGPAAASNVEVHAQCVSSACGGTHVLVLPREALASAMGSDWIRNRKLAILTGVHGVPFTATAPGPWAPISAAAAFAFASSAATGAAMVRVATARATNTSAVTGVGYAASDPSVSLVASNGDALAMLALHLRDVPFFGRLDGEALDELARCVVVLRRKRDTVIITEGSPADALFVVVHGHLKILTQGAYASTMGPGAYVGEVSMLKNTPARATVVTADDCLLLAISKPSFENMARKATDIRAAFSDRIAALLELARPWKQLKYMRALTDYQLGWLAMASRPFALRAGKSLRLCKRHNEGCLLVGSGSVSVSAEAGRSVTVGPGCPIGLHNLLATSTSDPILGDSDDTAAMTVTAVTDATFVRITRQDVMSVFGSLSSSDAVMGNFDAATALIAAWAFQKAASDCPDVLTLLTNHAFASVLTRSRQLRAALLTWTSIKESATQLKELLDGASVCDDVTQRMLAYSPTAAPLLLLAPVHQKRLEAVVLKWLAADASPHIAAAINADTRSQFMCLVSGKPAAEVSAPWPNAQTLAAMLPSVKSWPTTVFADTASCFDLAVQATVLDFTRSHAARQAVRSVVMEASQPSNAQRGDLRDKALQTFVNSVVSFNVQRLNRFGRWYRRNIRIFVRMSLLELEDSSNVLQRMPVTSIQTIECMSKDSATKQVRLTFARVDTERELVLRFEGAEARDTFITLLHMLAPEIPVTEDCMVYLGGGRVSYDVLLVTRGLAARRVLTIDSHRRMLVRGHRDDAVRSAAGVLAQEAASLAEDDQRTGTVGSTPQTAASPGTGVGMAAHMPQHEFAITLSTRLESSVSDPCRLKLSFGSSGTDSSMDAFEVLFPTPAAREHFAGSMRSLIYNVNVPAARLLGLHRTGIVPDVLSIFVGTFNCGESKPPKDAASLAAWIPVHRYDIIVVGLQECNARDEWIKCIESALQPANAPTMTAAPVYLAINVTPAPAPSTDTSTAKEREDPDLAPLPDAKESKPSRGGCLFGMLTGKTDKDASPKEQKGTGTALMGFDSMAAPSKESQSAAHGGLEQFQESCDMLGYKRDVATGVLAPPATGGRGRMDSMSGTSSFGELSPSRPAAKAAATTGGKAGKLLGLGISTRPAAGKGGIAQPAAAEAGVIRPDPPVTPSPYVTVCAATLWGIHLVVFARATIAQHISNVQNATTATGIGGVLGNKGGVGVSMVYREATSFAFVTSHLAARPERVNQRAENYSEICRSMRLSAKQGAGQLLHQFDHVFWLGDLNYRIDMGNMGTPDEFSKVQTLIASKQFNTVLAADQLVKELDAGRIFAGFREGPIRFAPTYRMEKGRDEYSNKRYQNASYTDRILWRSREGLRTAVTQLYYDASFSLNMSDHRPVSAGFIVGTRLPYIHLEHLDSVNHGGMRMSCTISFGYVRYDDVVLPRDAQASAEVGIDVSPIVETIQRARSKVLTASLTGDNSESSTPADAADGSARGASGGFPTDGSAALYSSDGSVLLPSSRADDYYLEITAPFLESAAESYLGAPVNTMAAGSGSMAQASASMPSPSNVASARSLPPFSGVPLGSCSAEWTGDAIPDVSPLLPDARWLQQLDLHVTVRRKGGALVGQAEVCLRDAYACMQREVPTAPEALTLQLVFSHPVLSRAFAAFLTSQRSDESLHFYRACIAYQELTAVGGLLASAEVRYAAACVIAETYLWPSAVRMVNVPGNIVGALKTAFSKAEAMLLTMPPTVGASAAPKAASAAVASLFGLSAKLSEMGGSAVASATAAADEIIPSDLFSAAAEEVFHQMEREAVPPFRQMYFSGAAACGMPMSAPGASTVPQGRDTALGTSLGAAVGDDATAAATTPCAPFAVPLLRDGCTVGLLRGTLFITCLDALAEKSRRLADLQKLLKRRSSARRTTESGMNSATPAFTVDEAASSSLDTRLAAMGARFGSALSLLTASLTGSTSSPSAPTQSVLSELARLPAGDKTRLSQTVDGLLQGVDFGPQAADDYALLTETLMAAALAEREALVSSSAAEPSPASRSRAHASVLIRAAATALANSSADRSPATRALRVLLHLAIQRLAQLSPAEGVPDAIRPPL